MSTTLENQEPDIKISVRQTFNIDTDMEVNSFSKKISTYLKLITIINLIEIQLLQFCQVLHLIKECWCKVITEQGNQPI